MTEAIGLRAIICLYQGEESERQGLDMAFGLTATFDAALRVIHVTAPPMTYLDPLGAGVMAGAAISEGLIASITAEDDRQTAVAAGVVAECAERHRIKLSQTVPDFLKASRPKAMFAAIEGAIDDCAIEEARLNDLIVITRPDDTSGRRSEVLAALLDSGRPVWLAPPSSKINPPYQWKGDRVGVAWDGSASATRALLNALMLIDPEGEIYILCVQDGGHGLNNENALAISSLKARGLHAIYKTIQRTEASTAAQLLKTSRELQLNCLVMGAFGHSALAERLFGGTSQYILDHADLPILMSH